MFIFDPSLRLLEQVAVSLLCHLAVGQDLVLEFARVGFRRKQLLAFGPTKESYHEMLTVETSHQRYHHEEQSMIGRI